MSVNIHEYILALDSSCPGCDPLFTRKCQVPSSTLETLFSKVSSLKLNENTKYLSYHIFSRLYSPGSPTALLYVCLFISSKVYEIEPLTYSQLQNSVKLSKAEFRALEKQSLAHLDYKVLEFTLFEWVSGLIELSLVQAPASARKEIRNVAVLLCDFVYEEKNMLCEIPVGLIATALINCSLIILTKFTGEFLPIQLLAKALHLEMEVIHISSLFILNLSLGAEFCSKFRF